MAYDVYSNDMDNELFPDYDQLKQYGKPVALAECGPSIAYTGGQFDDMRYLNAKKKCPGLCYFVCCNDWGNVTVSLVNNANSVQLMNDANNMTLDKISIPGLYK